jgi:hypothetical protein
LSREGDGTGFLASERYRRARTVREFEMRKAILIGLLLNLEACASNGVRPLRPYEIATGAYHPAAEEQLVGSLMYEGGCLLFTNEDRTRQLLPIWPDGTLFEESMVTFHQPAKAEQRLVIGEEIRLDGQAVDWPELDSVRYAPFRRQCAAQPFFVSAVTPAN